MNQQASTCLLYYSISELYVNSRRKTCFLFVFFTAHHFFCQTDMCGRRAELSFYSKTQKRVIYMQPIIIFGVQSNVNQPVAEIPSSCSFWCLLQAQTFFLFNLLQIKKGFRSSCFEHLLLLLFICQFVVMLKEWKQICREYYDASLQKQAPTHWDVLHLNRWMLKLQQLHADEPVPWRGIMTKQEEWFLTLTCFKFEWIYCMKSERLWPKNPK